MNHQIEFKAMGCHMLASVDSANGRVRSQLRSVPAWFEAWEDSLSRFRPESELNRLNRSAGTVVEVSQVLWSVLRAAYAAEKLSAGLVTPTQLRELVAAGYSRSFDVLNKEQGQGQPAVRISQPLAAIELWPEERRLRLPDGMQLDFGGVGKGWAAHQAARRLQNYGPALVDAGGDIAISCPRSDGEPWAVGIEDPRDVESSLGTLLLGRCGVATSGIDYRRWKQGGVWKHHILDPRTGEPVNTDVMSATVIAPTVLEAETAAKTILILGSRKGSAWVEEHPGFEGLLVTTDNKVIHSSGLRQYLEE